MFKLPDDYDSPFGDLLFLGFWYVLAVVLGWIVGSQFVEWLRS